MYFTGHFVLCLCIIYRISVVSIQLTAAIGNKPFIHHRRTLETFGSRTDWKTSQRIDG